MSSIVFGLPLVIGGGALLYVAFRSRGGNRARRRRAGVVGAVAAVVLVLGVWVVLRPSSLPPVEHHGTGVSPSKPAPVSPPTEATNVPAVSPAAPPATPSAPTTSTTPAVDMNFPSYRTIMLQHLQTLRRDLEQARDAARQERQKSDALSRQLDEVQAQIKALTQEIDRQDRQTRELRERLKSHQEGKAPADAHP